MSEKTDLKNHWDRLYARTETEALGWYEEVPEETLHLVEMTGIKPEEKLLVAGAGTSTLIDHLVRAGYSHLVANDISKESLSALKHRVSSQYSENIDWVVEDLTNPLLLVDHQDVALWIDRAVLHFLTDRTDQERYFQLLNNCVQPGGYVIFGEFSLSGATQCAGLPVYRYSKEMLQERIGAGFQLIEYFEHTYINPSGAPRQYIYTLFRKNL